MKKIFFHFLIVLTVFTTNLYGDTRQEPKDIILGLDKSLSMEEEIEEVKRYVNENIVESLIKDDFFLIIAFYMKAEVAVARKIEGNTPEEIFKEKQAIKKIINTVWADGDFTDIGNVLDRLRDELVERLQNDRKKNFLLITDGVHEPTRYSKYWSDDGSFTHEYQNYLETQFEREGWKLQILNIGRETHVRKVAESLQADYYEVRVETPEETKAPSGGTPEKTKAPTAETPEKTKAPSAGTSKTDPLTAKEDPLLTENSGQEKPDPETTPKTVEKLTAETIKEIVSDPAASLYIVKKSVSGYINPDGAGELKFTLKAERYKEDPVVKLTAVSLVSEDFSENNILKENKEWKVPKNGNIDISIPVQLNKPGEPGEHEVTLSFTFGSRDRFDSPITLTIRSLTFIEAYLIWIILLGLLAIALVAALILFVLPKLGNLIKGGGGLSIKIMVQEAPIPAEKNKFNLETNKMLYLNEMMGVITVTSEQTRKSFAKMNFSDPGINFTVLDPKKIVDSAKLPANIPGHTFQVNTSEKKILHVTILAD